MTSETATMPTIVQAEKEAQEATSARERLEAALRDGDATVTPEALEEASRRERFALLQAEGARNAAARNVEQARKDRAAALVAEHRPILDQGQRRVVDRFTKALRAQELLGEAVEETKAVREGAFWALYGLVTAEENGGAKPIPDFIHEAVRTLGLSKDAKSSATVPHARSVAVAAAEEAASAGGPATDSRTGAYRRVGQAVGNAEREDQRAVAFELMLVLPRR